MISSHKIRFVALAIVLLFGLLSNFPTSANDISYIYDAQNRLVEVHYHDKIIHYTYDDAGNRTGQTVEILVAAPSITNLSPNSATIGGSAFTLTVNGQNFTNNSIVQWNGANHSTTFVNANQLTVNIPASDLNSIGTSAVTVLNQTTSSVSNTQFFTVQSGGNCLSVSVANNLTAPANSTITVPVLVQDLTGKGVDSYYFTLSFDSNVIRPLVSAPIASTGTLSSGFNITANNAVAGKLQVGAYGATPLSGSGTLLNLNFEVIGTAGTNSALAWSQSQFNEGDPCETTSNGLVTVSGSGNQISGSITYGIVGSQGVKTVANTTLAATGNSQTATTTNNTGDYILSGLGNGNYTITPSKSGDIGQPFSTIDATRVLQAIVGTINLTPQQMAAADSDATEDLSTVDASNILRAIVGLPNTGSVGQWKFLPSSRSYPGLSSNLSSQDFEGVVIGDVDGDWTPPSSGNSILDSNSPELLPSPSGKSLFSQLSEKPSAPTAVNVSLPTDATAGTGTTVTIPITVGDTTGQNITGFNFVLNFDSSVIQPLITPTMSAAVSRTGTLSEDFGCQVNATVAGELRVACAGDTPLAGMGTLLNLRFNVVGTAPTRTDLTFNLFRFNSGTPAATTNIGQFTVMGTTAAPVNLSGRVSNSFGRGIQNVTITMTDNLGNNRTANTTAFGYYRFSNVAAGETYIISAKAKRYTFVQPTLVVNAGQDLTEINFTALP